MHTTWFGSHAVVTCKATRTTSHYLILFGDRCATLISPHFGHFRVQSLVCCVTTLMLGRKSALDSRGPSGWPFRSCPGVGAPDRRWAYRASPRQAVRCSIGPRRGHEARLAQPNWQMCASQTGCAYRSDHGSFASCEIFWRLAWLARSGTIPILFEGLKGYWAGAEYLESAFVTIRHVAASPMVASKSASNTMDQPSEDRDKIMAGGRRSATFYDFPRRVISSLWQSTIRDAA